MSLECVYDSAINIFDNVTDALGNVLKIENSISPTTRSLFNSSLIFDSTASSISSLNRYTKDITNMIIDSTVKTREIKTFFRFFLI